MKEHVQECPVNGMPIHMTDLDHYYGRYECQCEILRACEQRVLDAIDLPAANVQYQKVGYKFGYAAGLDAAREAVVAKALHSRKCLALLPAFNERDCNCACAYALAAIDALKEKP